MRFVQWSDTYKIGHQTVDDQHKKLVGMIGRLQRSIDENLDSPKVADILKELVEYTQYHFRDEETLMAAINYPYADQHHNLHKKLLSQIVQILTDLKAGKDLTALDLIEFLQKWLVEHIIAHDSKIGEALRAKRAPTK